MVTNNGSPRGRKIVLAASTSEASEYQTSTWRQMLLGTLPANYARFPFYMIDVSWENEIREDGQAVAVPNGLRVIESLFAKSSAPEDIAVCLTDQLDLFVGPDTKVVGVHAHNPARDRIRDRRLHSHVWPVERAGQRG